MREELVSAAAAAAAQRLVCCCFHANQSGGGDGGQNAGRSLLYQCLCERFIFIFLRRESLVFRNPTE